MGMVYCISGTSSMKSLIFISMIQFGTFSANEITSVPEVSTVTTPRKQFRQYNNFNHLMQLYAQNARLETHVTHLRSANLKLSNKVNRQEKQLMSMTSVLDKDSIIQFKNRVDKLEKFGNKQDNEIKMLRSKVTILEDSNEKKTLLIHNLTQELNNAKNQIDNRFKSVDSTILLMKSSGKSSVRFYARLTGNHINSGESGHESRPIKYNHVFVNVGSGYDPNT